MIGPAGDGARRAAERLAAEFDPKLALDVEAELQGRARPRLPEQYLDPVSLAGLVVSVASLAWTVYRDLRKQSPAPAPEVVARRVRVDLQVGDDLPPEQRDRIISVVVEETVRAATSGRE